MKKAKCYKSPRSSVLIKENKIVQSRESQRHSGAVVSTDALQQPTSWLQSFCGCVCVGSLQLLRLPPTVQTYRLIGNTHTAGVNVSVNVVCLYVKN